LNNFFFDNKVEKSSPTIWIDLKPSEITNTHKYVIRVLTKSHPWGYQRKNNQSTLTLKSRREALEGFKKFDENYDKYTNLDSKKVFPYSADLPVPLSFVLDFVLNQNINDKDYFFNKCLVNLPFIKTDTVVKQKLNDFIYSEEFVAFMLKIKNSIIGYKLPAIITKKEIINDTDETEDKTSSDPTLFVRLNSAGTRIDGEELIYSIYKSEFPTTKDLVENLSADFIRPSLLISIFTRIVWSKINDDKYSSKFSVNEFRKRLKDKSEFKLLLETWINDGIFKNLFENAKDILISENGFKIPAILVKTLIEKNSELFLGLLFWLNKNNIELSNETIFCIKKRYFLLNLFSLDITNFIKEKWIDLAKIEFWHEWRRINLFNL
jgi:hypothetical protein